VSAAGFAVAADSVRVTVILTPVSRSIWRYLFVRSLSTSRTLPRGQAVDVVARAVLS
jgi:hypothetical protein